MKRGELYLIPDDPDDPSGKKRPVVVVSRTDINGGKCVVCVPFYSQQLEKRRAWRFCAAFSRGEGNLDRDCVAKADQIMTVEKTYLSGAPLGTFNEAQMDRVTRAIRYTIGDD